MRVTGEEERIGLNMAEHGASTAILDLLGQMEEQRHRNDFSRHILSEPHTEVGQIAEEYNRVLDTINTQQQRQELDAALAYSARLDGLFQEIAKVTNESPTIEDAMQVGMDLICQETGWPVGHLYLLSENDNQQLLPTSIWHLENQDRFETSRHITEQTDFRSGVGLPGRVLASGKPDWIPDVTQDPNFPRAQLGKDIGVKAGFGFPILIAEQVAGVSWRSARLTHSSSGTLPLSSQYTPTPRLTLSGRGSARMASTRPKMASGSAGVTFSNIVDLLREPAGETSRIPPQKLLSTPSVKDPKLWTPS